MSTQNILIVNPNSTESMTISIQNNIEDNFATEIKRGIIRLNYMTAPASSPSQIDSIETSIQSENSCFPILINKESIYYFGNYDGVLIACFSDHPLIKALTDENSKNAHKTSVIGLLDSSIHYCNVINSKPFSIITSNGEWVSILNNSVKNKYLTVNAIQNKLWRGTIPTDLQVLDLHSDNSFIQIVETIRSKNVKALKSKIVILGCAGFSGLQKRLTKEFKGEGITFVDSVLIGVSMLTMIISFNKKS